MKLNTIASRWLPSATLGLILAGSTTWCWAGNPIVVNTFDAASEASAWTLLDPTDGQLQWIDTEDAGGTANKGALKVVLSGATATQIQPAITLGAKSFDSSKYWSLSFDIKVDASSSLNSSGTDYGHIQAVLRNATYSWNGINWSLLDQSATNWQHMEIGFMPPYDSVASLVFQLQGDAYTGDVIFYLDNIQVNPVPQTYTFTQFTNAAEANATGWNWANWSQPGSTEWVASPDAGGGAAPGSLKVNCTFNDPPTPDTYQQVVFQKNFDSDPNRFTYLDMDVKLDPSSYPMENGNTYGTFEVILAGNGNWAWASLGTTNLTLSNTNWTHLSYPVAGTGLTNMHAFIIKLGGGWAQDGFTNSVVYYIDNVKFWSPEVSPTLSLLPSGPGGLRITSTNPSDDWQRQNIVTPATTRNYSWAAAGQPVTYSFALSGYPDAVTHPGFEAHIYLVNYDTLIGPSFDETYSAVDWNAADLINAKIQNNPGGGVDFSFTFKTNLPGAGTYQTVATIHDTTALGTWSLTFNSLTDVTLTTASGAKTNFTISADVANAFNAEMTLDFGTFKAGGTNTGASATFSHIQVTGVPQPIDETFPGPGLNPDPTNPFWRLAADPLGISWVPAGNLYWLTWSLPDSGFTVQSSASVNGPWTDANLSNIVTGQTSRSAPVLNSNLPSTGTGYFRMAKSSAK